MSTVTSNSHCQQSESHQAQVTRRHKFVATAFAAVLVQKAICIFTFNLSLLAARLSTKVLVHHGVAFVYHERLRSQHERDQRLFPLRHLVESRPGRAPSTRLHPPKKSSTVCGQNIGLRTLISALGRTIHTARPSRLASNSTLTLHSPTSQNFIPGRCGLSPTSTT